MTRVFNRVVSVRLSSCSIIFGRASAAVLARSVRSHKEIRCHAHTDCDYEPSYPRSWQLQGVVGSEISAQRRPANHDQRLRPIHGLLGDEHDHRQAIGRATQDYLERVHLVNVGHPERSKHSEDDESHSSTEVAAIDRDQKLET